MPRSLRIVRVDAWCHITSRGNERRSIFRDDRDRKHLLELFGEMTELFRVVLHSFVLMENHYHLMLQLTEANLSRAIQEQNWGHILTINN